MATRKKTVKYLRRVRQGSRSEMDDQNTIQAITSLTASDQINTITWPKEDIRSTDIKTWKLLVIVGKR